MPVLEPDASIRLPAVTVIKASAGSGKTYTLTERYVQFALSREIAKNDPRNILAVTFSNNASREMKENVLQWLKLLCFKDPKRTDDVTAVVSGGADSVKRRAAALLDEILSRFTDFQVRTIDSFMSAVFRASAFDFGFSPEFEILMDPDPLIDYAFDLFLRDAREGSPRAALLDETVFAVLGFQGEGDKFPWDPSSPFLAEVKKIEAKLSMLEGNVTPEDHSAAMRGLEREIRERMEWIRRAIDSSGLEENRRSAFPDLLTAVRSGRFADLMTRGMKSSPVKKPAGKGSEAFEGIRDAWAHAESLVSRYTGLWARSFYLPYLRLHAELSSTVERAKKGQAKVFMGDINRRLGEYLADDIVPDVYFRLGEKVFHFLIDEFQDTSPIQWKNLFPLVENSLSEGGSLFVVGDAKQAIYGFRQADYTIMRSLETACPFPSARHSVKELTVNYRSRSRILELAERVFLENAAVSKDYGEAARASGLDRWTQHAAEDADPGYVEVEVLTRDDDEPPERPKIQGIVEELHDRGYRWGDIAILAPRNEDVLRATSWLSEKGIPFISFSSLDVRRRRIAAEIISLLSFLDSPPDDLSFASFLLGDLFTRHLKRRGLESGASLHRFIFEAGAERPLYKVFQREFPRLWEECFSGLFRSAGYLPLYDLACEVFSTFALFVLAAEEEATLAKLLEAVKDFEGSGSNSLRDFLSSASDPSSESGQWSIEVPRSADSVRVMTVHKAKGLGFPVVIVLLYGERSRGFEHTVQRVEGGISLVKLTRAMADRDPALGALYEEESTREKVSRLNGLYVALTRAKSEMYVIGVQGERDGYPFDLLPAQGFSPRSEKGPARSEGERPEANAPLAHDTRPLSPSQGRGRLAVEERRRGELVHRVLSLIQYSGADVREKIERAARRAAREARVESVEEGLVDEAAALIRDGRIAPYFAERPGRSILAEQEFCDEAGRLFRMDRLVVDADRVTVLDFKTGAEEASEAAHDAQMRSYIRILTGAYPGRRIEALLVYTDRRDVRRVS